MSTDVNTFVGEIPRDLVEQAQVVLAILNSDDIAADELAVLPPDRIAVLVLIERDQEQESELVDWITNQMNLWDQVAEMSPQFTDAASDQDDIPAWRDQKWAMAFESKWGAGLADAVEQARAWLAKTST
jgi:hypothetical protein